MSGDDFLIDDVEVSSASDPSGQPPWRVLVVDDSPDMIAVTRAVLDGCRYADRDIQMLTARSAAEARHLLERHPDTAAALIDVVMETDDAGLRLVTTIRDELQMRAMRIILRTGQPGRAPERDVFCNYDINDYRLKNELTAHSLYTSVIAALRGYAEITARIHAEQEVLLAARSKSQFLASISHELRTPLNAIIGFADIIKSQGQASDFSQRTLEYVVEILDNGRLLLAVVNELIDMASIDAGHYHLREQVLAVVDFLEASKAAALDRANAAGVTLTVHASEQVPLLLADKTALLQVLDNLLSNAIKFSSRGGTVELSVVRSADGRPTITVSDHGIGIPANRLHGLFRPFTQLDADITRSFAGIGLGLAIVKGLVALHGGTVDVASVEGEGTTMTILLPQERLIEGAVPPRRSNAPCSPFPHHEHSQIMNEAKRHLSSLASPR